MVNGNLIEDDEQGLIHPILVTKHDMPDRLREVGYNVHGGEEVIPSMMAVVLDLARRVKELEDGKTK